MAGSAARLNFGGSIVQLVFGGLVLREGWPYRRRSWQPDPPSLLSLFGRHLPCGRTGVGMMIETAMVGHDGALNAASALDGKVSLNKGIVQTAGSAGTIEVNRLRRLANELEPFRSLLIRHEQVLFAQSQQSAACNASH